jgi:predicted nucleotidyltransferase
MKYKIEKNKKQNSEKYQPSELDLAFAFAKEAKLELKEFLQAVILFGSAARRVRSGTKTESEGDIDLLVLLNDISINPTQEIIETYKIISQKIIGKVSKRIHLTTMKLSSFWEYLRIGDPVGINLLRDGVAIIDTGFFEPMQALLFRGKIKPSYESTWEYYNRAPKALNGSRAKILEATVDLYWAVMDSGQAVLMKLGNLPPPPELIGDFIDEKLVKQKRIEKKYADTPRKFYKLYKEITHRKIGDISGKEYEKYYSEAKEFVEAMRKILITIKDPE